MRWEHMVPKILGRLSRNGLCIVPTGSLERHGEHLPFGCDMIISHTVACKAAEIEPAVVFPLFHDAGARSCLFYRYGQLSPGFCHRSFWTAFKVHCCQRIQKILVVNGHGGNNHMLDYFAMSRLDEPTDYIFYYTNVGEALTDEERRKIDSLWKRILAAMHVKRPRFLWPAVLAVNWNMLGADG